NFDSDKAARAIILVTDGAANCNNTLSACFVDPKSQECFEELFEIYDERLAQVVADAFNNESITTYVVGIDIQDTPPEDVKDGKPMANPHVELNKVAIAGGAPRDDANVKYYNASNELDLQS